MKIRTDSWQFYLALLGQLQLDLLLLSLDLQGVLAILLLTLTRHYRSTRLQLRALIPTVIAWMIENLIVSYQLMPKICLLTALYAVYVLLQKTLQFKTMEYYLLFGLALIWEWGYVYYMVGQLPNTEMLAYSIAINLAFAWVISRVYIP